MKEQSAASIASHRQPRTSRLFIARRRSSTNLLLTLAIVLLPLAIDVGSSTTVVAAGNSGPSGLTLEITQPPPPAQDVYVSDPGNNDIVKIAPNGVQTTVGSGFEGPQQIAVDAQGDLFVADMNKNRVEKVTPAGVQTQVIGNLDAPTGVAVDGAGDVFVSNTAKNTVLEVTPSGTVTTVASGLAAPAGLAVNAAGGLFIANTGADQILEVTPLGTRTTYGTVFNQPFGVTVDAQGNVYVSDSGDEREVEVTPAGDGVEPVIAKNLMGPIGSALNAAGDVYITEFVGGKVLEVEPGGASTTIGTGFVHPYGVAVSPVGPTRATAGQPVTLQANAFPPGSTPPTGTVQFFAGSTLLGESELSVTAGATGGVDEATLLATALRIGTDTITARYLGDDNYPGSQASAKVRAAPAISGVTVHVTSSKPPAPNVYIADTGHNRVVEVSPSGTQVVVPATGLKAPEGVAVDGAGDLYIADTGNNRVVKISSTGTQSTLPATGLDRPTAVAVDGGGNVYIADDDNNRIVKLTPGGAQSVVDADAQALDSLAVDAAGDLFIPDANNNRTFELSAQGVMNIISTQSGGTPEGVAVDAAGNVFVAYTANNDVVQVTPSGAVASVSSAGLSAPRGLAVDSRGDTYISDSGNDRIVEVTPRGAQTSVGTGLSNPSDVAVSPVTTSTTSGKAVGLTTDLAPAGAGAPTGDVTFKLGTTTLGKIAVAESSQGYDTASLTTSSLPVGTDTVVATYTGDTTFGASSGSCVVAVKPK